ncbi:hypothetical protein [Streptomyces sp. NPDC089919]|uniref:hypothetical protein n=1 Tax=Streptomyces sp. NPDC089919 TaxID=3155188 RepID=UPI00343B2D71
MRNRTRRTARWALSVALPLALLVAAPPARADARGMSNGFENGQTDRWDRQWGGDGRAGFELNTGTARSGEGNGWLSATRGWAREGIWASFAPQFRYCTATVYVKPLQDLQFELRVWTPQGKKLISTAPWLLARNGYSIVQVDWMGEGDNANFVEAVIGADGTARTVRLDDMAVVCAD